MQDALPNVVQRRFDPAQRYGLRLTLLGVAIVLVAVPFSTLVFQVLAKGPATRLDGEVANDLNHLVRGHDWLITFLQAVSWTGRPPFLAVVVGAAVIYIWRHASRRGVRIRLVVFLIVTPIGGGIVDTLVKLAVNRPRPEVDHPVVVAFGKSFPSGHSMTSLITYGALLLTFLPLIRPARRRITIITASVLVLAIGSSRLFLGVHFVTDVIGGYILGLAWLCGAVAAFEIWRTEEGRAPAAPLKQGVEPGAAQDLARH
jgi:undecaprenyl-diphosphatase